MNRCFRFSAAWPVACLAAGLLLALAPTGHAQTAAAAAPAARNFPKNALRGTLQVTAPPEIRLDGSVARLSPGARIRGADNMLVMSGNIVGRELVVNYTRESHGLVHEVWILNETEAREKRPGATSPRNFIFASEEAPVRDDGKTPYNQLPGYNAPR